MAIISTKGSYGLTAIVILAKEEDNKLLQIKDIAAKGDIPQNYLEQILVILKKNGLVESVRGANGGYKLSRSADKIMVFEVLNSLECCLAQTENKSNNNMLQPFWEDTQEKVKKIFLITVKELVEFLERGSNNIIYHI
ncbi:MAG: Rrf2 family cysteine metabolism transcriptional repressor [Sulfurimonas sp.]|jgi:Rrf2 family cysteine metabolism transcriptional repressor